MDKLKKNLFMLCCVLCLASCTTMTPYEPVETDPLQAYNRNMFYFNQGFDKAFLVPLAALYNEITPWPLREGVSNFFNNLGEVPTIINSLLQGSLGNAGTSSGRLLINSTLGILGLFDVATELGLEQNHQDFGLTLAHWGYHQSAYFIIPFLGPSTIRDILSLPVNTYMTVNPYISDEPVRYALLATNIIQRRASLLAIEEVRKLAAFDPYVFQRDAYLQRRDLRIQGGEGESDPYVDSVASLAPSLKILAIG